MKRRFLAWVTAAAMLITSVPGNAVTAFAEELPEEVAAEAVTDEEPVEQEVTAEESADLYALDPELEEDSSDQEIQAEDVYPEAEDPVDEELVEDFTVEEDDPEEDTLQDGILFAEEEDSSAEEDSLSEEEILAAESDSEITGIELSCKDPSGLLDPDSEIYLGQFRDLPEATVTYADGEPETANYWSWSSVEIDGNFYAVLTNDDTGVGLLVKNSAGEILPSFAQGIYDMPICGEVWLQPFILGSEDYDQFEDSQICVTFPTIDDVSPLTEGEAAEVGDEGWFSFTQNGNSPYAITVSAESEADVEWRTFRYSELDSYGFINHYGYGSLRNNLAGTSFVNGGTSTQFYIYVKNDSPESNVTVKVQRASAVSAIELEDAAITRFELLQHSLAKCFHATAICADQTEYPISFNGSSYYVDNISYVYGNTTRGEYIEIRAVDENGNQSDFGGEEEGQIPAGEYRIQAVYSGEEGEIRSQIRTLTVTEGMPESTTLEEGQTADYSVSAGDSVYFKPVAEEDDEYRFALTGTSDGNNDVSITIYEQSDDAIEQVSNTTLYLYGEQQTFDVTLSGGKEYILQLTKPSWDMGSTNGTISFYSIAKQEQREYERILAAAVPIQPGQTKDAVWKANEDTRNYFLFEPEESGTYLFYSDGTIDTRVTLYEVTETHLENIDDNDDGRNDDYCNFLLRSELTAGKSYIYETYLWGSTSTEESSTVTLETVPTLESVVLNYSGSTPTFIEGLSSGWNAYPFSLFGDHLNASVKYENQDPEVFEDVNEESVITKYGDYYRFAAIQGFDTDGTPVNATRSPGAGDWYASLADIRYEEDENEDEIEIYTFLPKTKQESEWTPSLETVSTVPFTVITKAEAASENAFDGDSVTINPESTYFAGAALTADQDGMVEFSSDLAVSIVYLYKAGSEDTEDEQVLVSKTDNFTWRAELEADQTYYLFVRPTKVTPFTITARKPVSIASVEISSRLASTIRPLQWVSVNDFSVDLTYDDGSVAHLTGGEQDAYGNSFRYEAESDDDYYYVSNENYSEALRQGNYQVRAVLNASGSYIYSESTVPLTVSDPAEEAAVETAAVQTVAAGSNPLYRFVPEETGFYTVLMNGAPYYGEGWYKEDWRGRLTLDDDQMLDASTDMLWEGIVYYIPIGEVAVDQYITVTRRYPVEISESNSNFELNAKADADNQFMFTVPENGNYRIAVDAGTMDGGFNWELMSYHPALEEYDDAECSNLVNGYSDDSSAEIYYALKEGNTYLLSSWTANQTDDFTMTFSVEKAEEEATVDVTIDTEYPAAFAGDFPQEVIQITETMGGQTQTITTNENTTWSGSPYWLDYTYGNGHSKNFYICGGFLSEESNRFQATFNEHAIDNAPFLSAGTACTDGYRIKNTWFYFFIPEETGLYHVDYQGSGNYRWILRTYDNRYWVSPNAMQLQAGVKYAIACYDPEVAGSPKLTISKAKDVERVEITQAPAGILRQNLNGSNACEVKVSYSDGDSKTYQLPGSYKDDYGNSFNVSGAILPLAAGADPATQKVRFKVEIGGRKASCDVPLLSTATLPILPNNIDSAQEIAYTKGSCWYQYSPVEDGYYAFYSTFTERMNYSWEVFEEGSSSPLSHPIYLKKGNVYIVVVYTMNDSLAKIWVENFENSTVSDMKTLTYEFVAEDDSLTLPKAVRNELPEGGDYLRNTELAVAQPGETEVRLAAGTWTFMGYDYSRESVRLDTDRTITGTWSFEAAETPPCEHTQLRLVEAKAATCTEDGYEAYYVCEECGRLFSDAAGTEEILSPAVIPGGHILAFHAKAEADCEHDGYEAYYECSRCGKLFSDAAGTKEIDAPVVIPGGHNLVFHERVEPTCDAYGCEAYYECSRCHKLFSDAAGENQIEKTIPIPPSHELTFMEAVEPTCTEAGTAAHYVCDNCGRLFSDAAGTAEITADSVVIPAAGHTYNLVEANAPTADEPGNIEYYHCPKCGKNFSDTTGAVELTDDQIVIPKLGSYNVTFHGNGGYSVDDETQDVVVVVTTAGECVETIPQFIHPDDLELLGWATDSDGTDPVDIENYPIEKAEDFYAIWKAEEQQTFTVSYEFKSGSDRDLPQEIQDLQESLQEGTVLEGESVYPQWPNPSEIETDDGYRWYFEEYEPEYVEEAYEDITFIGWWYCEAPEGDCKITWHKNFNGSTETETEWVYSGQERYNAPPYWDDDEDILAAGKIAGGFYVGSPEGELIDDTDDQGDYYEVNGNIDLYVYWVDAVTITWDPMGGSWDYYDHEIPNGATAPKTARYYVGRYLAINEEGNLTAPNENQVFAGWSLEPNGEIFMPRTNGKRATEDLDGVTLYAVYKEQATITIVGGEGAHSWMYDDENDVNGYFGPSTVIVEWPKGIEFDLLGPTYFQKEGAAIRGWTVGDTTYDTYYRFTPDADVTITAVWARPVTVKYFLMGGHFSWNDEDYMEEVYGEGEAIRNYSVVKENYVFCGWNTNEEEAAAGITEYSQYTTLYAQNDIELYAVWKPGFTVTFELNGGTHLYHPGSSFTTTVLPGDMIGSTYYTDGLTAPEGKAFVAWTTVLNDPSTAIPENNPLKVTDNITLYALYANGYSVTFDLNGVTNAEYPEGVYTISMPEGATIASDYNWYEMVSDTVAPSGKAFVGWSTEKNNPDTLITEDNPLVLGQNTILYAFWGDGCAVTFNGMGGLHQNQGTITFSFPVNSTIQLVPSFDWTDSSKAFAYWSTDQGGNGKYTTSGLFGYKLVSDITLYAIWKPGCTVTFDANGGTYYSGTRFTDIYPAGEPIAEHLPYPQGPDENKTLLGYSTTTDRSGLVFNWAQNNLDCVFEDGMLLYAIWADKRTLTFKGNGRKLNARTDTVSVDWPDGEGYYGAQDRVVSDDLKDELKGWSTSPSGSPLFDFTGKTVTSDMTFYAVWGEPAIPKYEVSYEFVSSSDKELPREVLTLKPGPAEYEDGTTVTAAQMPERVDTVDGHWTFDGYDKNSITLNGADDVFTGTWTYVEERATVVYTFVSEDGSDLPAEVTALMPDYETTAVKGTDLTPVSPKADSVEVGDYNWTFLGYAPASAKAGGEGTTVTFTGTWRAVPKETTIYYITYQFTPAALPAEVMALLPARTPVEEDAAPVCASLTKTTVATEEGNWIFEGFDTSALPSVMTGDVTVTGNWRFESKEAAAEAAAGMITDITGDTDSNELIDALENSDSADILNQLTENLKTEAGDDEDALNELIADATGKVDDLLAEGDKITVNTGSQTVGAYVGKTEAGEDAETGVKVEVSGATATVASVIRNLDTATLLANDSKNYHYVAEVDVEKKEETDNSLTLDISLNVVIRETGDVVRTNVEPTSPVTITLTLPDDYVGYNITLIHTKEDGSTETVKVSYINAETQIRFTVSSLSPFKLQKGEDRHPAVYVAALKATCAKAGHKEYWTRMGKKYADEACTKELTDADITIPKTKVHTWNTGVVKKAATEDVTGIRLFTCKVCGQTKTAVIPKVKVKITIAKKPAKFKAKAAKKGKVNLTWTKLAKKGKTKALFAQVKNYEIQYSTDKNFATGVVKKTAGKKKAKLTLKLKPKMTYYVRIRYTDGKGGYSPWVMKTVKTKK